MDPSCGKWNEQKHCGSISKKQHISCLVDGCTADLTCCRDYYIHRVCETHSKTVPLVTMHRWQRPKVLPAMQ